MKTGTELDRALAEALGERVCEGTLVNPMGDWDPHCDTCGETVECLEAFVGQQPHRPPPAYSTSWEAAHSLARALRSRGYDLRFHAYSEEGEDWRVVVLPHVDEDRPSIKEVGPLPHALALAALKALTGGGR
jgi:hypothetical protein